MIFVSSNNKNVEQNGYLFIPDLLLLWNVVLSIKRNLEPRSFAAMQHDMYMMHADSYTEKKPRWMFSI